MNMVLARELGKGDGIAGSPARLAAFASMLRSAASCVTPSSAACLNRAPVGERSSVACTLSKMMVPLSHLHRVEFCHVRRPVCLFDILAYPDPYLTAMKHLLRQIFGSLW